MDQGSIDRLQELLARRQAELAERIARENGEISPTEIVSLEAIHRLVQIGRADEKSLRKSRYVQIIFAAVITLTILTLLLLPLRHVGLELEAKVRSFRFKTESKGTIAQPLSVRRVVIQGQAKIYVPTAAGGKAVTLLSPIVELTAKEVGALKLEFPQSPAGTRVEITRLPADDGVEVAFCGIEEPARIVVTGPITVMGESRHTLHPKSPTLLWVVPRSTLPAGQLDTRLGACGSIPALSYRFVPEKTLEKAFDTGLELSSNLGIRDLELISETQGQDGMLQPRSSVVSGKLRITSVGRKVIPLSRNEFLVLKGNSGELLSFLLKPNALELFFEGSATGLYVGSRNNRSSITPTVFEWLKSLDQITLAWSTGLSALGLLVGLYRWSRGEK